MPQIKPHSDLLKFLQKSKKKPNKTDCNLPDISKMSSISNKQKNPPMLLHLTFTSFQTLLDKKIKF